MSRKVFTAGEVLAAADVNNFLMNQTVMSFAGTASRTASIGTPVEGMYTHLEDTDRLEFWNGSSWTSPHGLTLLSTTTFSAVTSHSVNNVFSSAYDNYAVRVTAIGNFNTQLVWRLRDAGGTDSSTSNYDQQGLQIAGGTLGNATIVGTTSQFGLMEMSTTQDSSAVNFEVFSPFLAARTRFTAASFGFNNAGSQVLNMRSGAHSLSNSYTGLTLLPGTGTITGTMSVYGYRKG
jgi:hypothetical protein